MANTTPPSRNVQIVQDVLRQIMTPQETTALRKRLAELEEAWINDAEARKDPLVRAELINCVKTSRNPYSAALFMFVTATDYAWGSRNTLSTLIISEFSSWLETTERFESLLDEEIQHAAFLSVANEKHTALLGVVTKTFELAARPMRWVSYVEELCEQKCYQVAAEIVANFGLQAAFPLSAIVIPCVLADRLHAVELYLTNQPQLQRELVVLLDTWCEWNNAAYIRNSICWEYERRVKIRRDKLDVKTLAKLVGRLAKLYNIPLECTPNVMFNRRASAIGHLLWRRYKAKNISDTSWEDLIHHVASGDRNRELFAYFLQRLVNYRDCPEAAYWARKTNMPVYTLPRELAEFMQRQTSEAIAREEIRARQFEDGFEEDVDAEFDGYLQLPDEVFMAVVIVDTRRTLDEFREKMKKVEVVGLDTEWAPSFVGEDKAAIIQVASTECLFILDVDSLSKLPLAVDEWRTVLSELFQSKSLRKLGFNFSADVRVLVSTFPECKDLFSSLENTVCLQTLITQLTCQHVGFVDQLAQLVGKSPFGECSSEEATKDSSDGDAGDLSAQVDQDATSTSTGTPKKTPKKSTWSLSDLCHYFLGKPLKKTECMTNWSRRPLRASQLRYAALDAYCELEVYEKMKEKAVSCRIDFEAAVGQSLVRAPSAPKVRRNPEQKKHEREELFKSLVKLGETFSGEVLSVRDVRVVVGQMLQGLGKQLRLCGVDCRILSNEESNDRCYEPPSKAMVWVPTNGTVYEQLAYVFRAFNIRLHDEDLFTRCTICNGAEFACVSQRQMRALFERASDALAQPLAVRGEEIEDVTVDVVTGCIYGTSTRVLVEKLVSVEVFTTVQLFYVCAQCGKIFWNGGHVMRYTEKMHSVIAGIDASATKG